MAYDRCKIQGRNKGASSRSLNNRHAHNDNISDRFDVYPNSQGPFFST